MSLLELRQKENIGLADRGGEVLAHDGACRCLRRCRGQKLMSLFGRVMREQAIAREHGVWITM
ncbi:hypothetical protein PV336_22625 [Streptomyces sp. MI02-2A]|uniref:hypothetical protein n=1 Tax=unclassified Streptomyces TaxID=2593676 RepID=UPI000740CDD7|nr:MULTISPECIES: hypothetical protein [unclassified Streptomyces]KUJ35806.1 hypothetical protein ADL25_35495 [Streptomyces sp. NRRL F-5122]MDX3262001.1 hypothetical protein [Streptomyces sp. MI02-2A]